VRNHLPEIECDAEQVKQVLLNLLINAAQASLPSSTVQLVASASGNRVTIEVIDQGAGIAPEQRDRIFDPFFTTKENGTGLGLAIASMIVEQHGGVLSVRGNPGPGVTFCLEFPLKRTEPL
jgi:signal transduction histidine kinase